MGPAAVSAASTARRTAAKSETSADAIWTSWDEEAAALRISSCAARSLDSVRARMVMLAPATWVQPKITNRPTPTRTTLLRQFDGHSQTDSVIKVLLISW